MSMQLDGTLKCSNLTTAAPEQLLTQFKLCESLHVAGSRTKSQDLEQNCASGESLPRDKVRQEAVHVAEGPLTQRAVEGHSIAEQRQRRGRASARRGRIKQAS